MEIKNIAWYSLTLIAVLTANVGFAQNSTSEDNINSKAELDAPLDPDQLTALDKIPDLNLTQKDILLPDGENLNVYLKKNSPDLLDNYDNKPKLNAKIKKQ